MNLIPSRLDLSGLPRASSGAAIIFGFLLCLSGAAWTEQAPYVITQKWRAFQPFTVTIDRNDALQFFNDDGNVLHHAYVESDSFSFDSGDQLPSTRTNVIFSVPGTFNVLCGIHPRMKLIVTVK